MIVQQAPQTTVKPMTTVERMILNYANILYSETLLLPFQIDQSITDDPHYKDGASCGFWDYFHDGWSREQGLAACRDAMRSQADLVAFLRDEIIPIPGACDEDNPLAWRIGFVHGYLSALSRTNRPLAFIGLEMATAFLPAMHGPMQEQVAC